MEDYYSSILEAKMKDDIYRRILNGSLKKDNTIEEKKSVSKKKLKNDRY